MATSEFAGPSLHPMCSNHAVTTPVLRPLAQPNHLQGALETHVSVCMYICMYACIICALLFLSHTHTYVRMCVCVYIYIYICIVCALILLDHTHIHKCTNVCMHVMPILHTYTSENTCVPCARGLPFIHTYIHTCIHTYTHLKLSERSEHGGFLSVNHFLNFDLLRRSYNAHSTHVSNQ